MSNLDLLIAMIDKSIKLSERRKKYTVKPRPLIRKDIWREKFDKPLVTSVATKTLCDLRFLR